MKTTVLKCLFTFALAIFALQASAQNWLEDPKYGESPEERQENVQNFNLYKDAYTNKDFDKALEYLPELMERVPKAFVNLYIYAANIYRTKIAQSTTLAEKNKNIEALMGIYDKRAENFANLPKHGRGYVLGLKAKDYKANKPMDRETIAMLFQEAIEAQGDQVDVSLINLYFQGIVEDFKNDQLEANYLMSEYEKLLVKFEAKSQNEEVEKARATFDALLISSGAASCENLEVLFKANIAAAPEDKQVYSKAIGFLTRAKCDSDFLIEIMEKLYSLEPNSDLAMTLANAFGDKKNNAKSLQYLNLAISGEADPVKKSNLSVQIAARELTAKNPQTAAKFAQEAISFNPENGYAYIILAQAYAIGSSACQGFDANTVYWLVSDVLKKARRLLSADDPQQITIKESLANYAHSFPSKEECFFRGLSTGAKFSVKCGWISGETIVREGN